MTTRLFLGTSGWHYDHWRGDFYPQDMPKNHWLDYYARHFNTVEINNSFYRLPLETTFTNWRQTVSPGFCFAVKASRYITHIQRLKDTGESVRTFTERARCLQENLGPILYQVPPNLHRDDERLEQFLKMLDKDLKHVLEFRHASWMEEPVYALLLKYQVGFCIFDMPDFTSPLEITADFGYVRFHGKGELYSGNYPDNDLADWAEKLGKLAGNLKSLYVYFNNDAGGYAIKNAVKLREMMEGAISG